MIQYDIDGSQTLIKEAKRKKPKKTQSQKVQERETEEKKSDTVYMTIEKNVTLKPHGIVTHTMFTKPNAQQSEKSRENIKPNEGEFNGYMSQATSRYVKRIVENWLTAIELNCSLDCAGRDDVFVTFVTLTLPSKQVHHDNLIKNECLDPFLEWVKATEIKKGWNVKCYLWRAESQKNGNLHFHLIVDRWIDHEAIRKRWNQLINRLGYVDMYRMTQNYIYKEGFVLREEQLEKQIENLQYVFQGALKDAKYIPDTKYKDCPLVKDFMNGLLHQHFSDKVFDRKKVQYDIIGGKVKKVEGFGLDYDSAKMLAYRMQVNAYEKGVSEGWKNPNTSDIHKLNNINSISAYITKYVSKSDIKTPRLADNQKLIDGYIYTLKEGGSWDNNNDWLDETKYIVEFESRKVQGRIWGKSRNLSDGENGKQISAPSFTTELKVLYTTDRFERNITQFRDNEIVSEYVENVKKQVPEKEQKRLAKMIDSEFCEVVPLGDYQQITDHSTKKKKKVFRPKKQIDYLEKLSQPIKEAYQSHYQNLYLRLYAD
ncbi:rolling circle replication-associated protein [Arcicella lustrica]|uniref:Replication-associated protein ORF2/G2P domain-containing protein n=1 Tax=Arcicella lustrica TaxID=2984196 RepID=A0ABU5SHW0_9BACT|nr:hypothetical protein [Arcicella sp. DC25W]MEA5426816.1 hypothetical protein [Arcicella sp. DC25W]